MKTYAITGFTGLLLLLAGCRADNADIPKLEHRKALLDERETITRYNYNDFADPKILEIYVRRVEVIDSLLFIMK